MARLLLADFQVVVSTSASWDGHCSISGINLARLHGDIAGMPAMPWLIFSCLSGALPQDSGNYMLCHTHCILSCPRVALEANGLLPEGDATLFPFDTQVSACWRHRLPKYQVVAIPGSPGSYIVWRCMHGGLMPLSTQVSGSGFTVCAIIAPKCMHNYD